MGQLHSAGSSKKNVTEERDRWLDIISTTEPKQNNREQETITKELKSFFSLDKSKTHSVLISSLRNTLNTLEHLIQKLNCLPLLKYSRETSCPEWFVDDRFTLEGKTKIHEENPIVTSANSLKESLKDARQLLEDFSFVSHNITFKINTTIQKEDSNQTTTKKLVLKDQRVIGSEELISESTCLAAQKMRLQEEPLCDQEIDDFPEEPFVLTESIIIFPSNERVKSAETCLASDIAHFKATSTIYQNDKTGSEENWSTPEAEFTREESFTEKRQLNVKDTDRTSNENDIIKGSKGLTREQRDDAIFPPISSKNMNESESQPTILSDLEFSEKTVIKPEIFFPWKHGLCETIIEEEEEEEEEEEVEEELDFDVSICSSPRSDLIFDSLQGGNNNGDDDVDDDNDDDDDDDDDDDGLLEQLADLRDDPDYEALVANETSSLFTKEIGDELEQLISTNEKVQDNLKQEITEITVDFSEKDKMENNIIDESPRIGVSSRQMFENYGDLLSEKILNEALLEIRNDEIEKPINNAEDNLIKQNSKSTSSGYFGLNFEKFLKDTINDILNSGLRKATKILLSSSTNLTNGDKEIRSNLEENENLEIREWLFRRNIELLKMDRENRMKPQAEGIHLSHNQGYILLKETK